MLAGTAFTTRRATTTITSILLRQQRRWFPAFEAPIAAAHVPELALLHDPWFQLGLALPVVLIGFSHFVPSALRSLRAGLPNMDVLIVIGVSAAFGYSLVGTVLALGPNFIFYETAATISSLVLRQLPRTARGRAHH